MTIKNITKVIEYCDDSDVFLLFKVKTIMNTVYRKLRQEFSPDGAYQGSDVQAVILDTIKVDRWALNVALCLLTCFF